MSVHDKLTDIVLHAANAARQHHDRRTQARSTLPSSLGPLSTAAKEEGVEIGRELPDVFQQRRIGPAYSPPPVVLSLTQRCRQIYGTGTSGSGKTSFALHLMDHDIAIGMTGGPRGVGCVDPEGDLIDRVWKRLSASYTPSQIISHVYPIDFREHHPWKGEGHTPHCVGWNPLRDAGVDPSAAALFCYDAFADVYEIGPASGELLRYVLLALANSSTVGESGQGTLLDIEGFIFDAGMRREALASVEDITILRFFQTRFNAMIANPTYVSAILNKLSPLTSIRAVRRHLGMRKGTLPLRDLVTRPGTILLCALASNEIGSRGAGLIGRLLIQSIARSFIRSDRLLTDNPVNFFLTLDEFSLFSNSDDVVTNIAAVGRRHGLHLLALHQSASQLDSRTRSILRNCVGSQIIFASGAGDADTLASELPSSEPKAVVRNWLITQKPGQAILVESGRQIRRIQCHHAPDPNIDTAIVAEVRQKVLENCGRPEGQVEAEIRAHEERYLNPSTVPSEVTKPRRRASATTSSMEIVEIEEGL